MITVTNTYTYIHISEIAFYALLASLEANGILDEFTFISQQGFIVIRFDSYGLIVEPRDEYQYTEEMRNQWIRKVKGDRYE